MPKYGRHVKDGLRGSFGEHEIRPGRLLLNNEVPNWVRQELREMNYSLTSGTRTMGGFLQFSLTRGTVGYRAMRAIMETTAGVRGDLLVLADLP